MNSKNTTSKGFEGYLNERTRKGGQEYARLDENESKNNDKQGFYGRCIHLILKRKRNTSRPIIMLDCKYVYNLMNILRV